MSWIVTNIKWIMIVSGALTCTMLYAAIAPEAALRSTFGEPLEGPLAGIIVRNWAVLIVLVGAGLIYGAYDPAILSPLLALGWKRAKSRRKSAQGDPMKRTKADDHGREDGPRKETFRDGTLSAVGRYSSGKKTGKWKYYYRNGRLKATGTYSAGRLEGPWRWYREGGGPLQEGRFKDGKQVGLWKRYHASGKLYDVGKYVDGEQVGVWKYYDKNGKLVRTKTY